MSTIVVYGASGFIGQHLVAAAKGLDFRVVTVPRNGVCPLSDREVRQATCIHLAGPSNIRAVETEGPALVAEQLRLARSIRARAYARIIFASSAAVYGTQSGHSLGEDSATAPQSRYAEMKLCIEQELLPAGACIARLANAYGPGMSSSTVLHSILSQLLGSEREVTLRSTADIRDYIFVADVVSAIMALVEKSPRGEVFNIGTSIGTSVGELYQLLQDQTGVHKPLKVPAQAQPTSLVLCNEKMKRVCNWSPRYALPEGLRFTISEFAL